MPKIAHIILFKVARELIIRASMFYEICKEKNLSDICSEDRKSGGQTLHACSSLYLHPLSGKGDDPKSSGQMLRAFSSLYPHPLSGKASKSYKIYEEKDLLDICSKDPKSGGEILNACSDLLCTYPLSGMI